MEIGRNLVCSYVKSTPFFGAPALSMAPPLMSYIWILGITFYRAQQ
ncbi:MAG: hypothetical protein ACTHME_01360 [Candidatus Nitrosocosmicus sp.]